MQHAVTLGGSLRAQQRQLGVRRLYTDEETFGFPDFSYVNPVIPDRSLWHARPRLASRTTSGITGLFGQYIVEPARRVVVTLAGRYDRLALDATRGTAARVERHVRCVQPEARRDVQAARHRHGSDWPDAECIRRLFAGVPATAAAERPQAPDTPLNLQPEDIENYEAGLKGSLLGGRLALEASYFYMTEDGVVINRFVNNRFVPSNAGQLTFKGFESGATWTPTQKADRVCERRVLSQPLWRLRHPELRAATRTLTGNRLVLSPDYIVNWGASVLPVPAVNLTFDVKHVSSTFGDDSNTAKIDGYTLFDAAATWQRGPLRVTLSGRNLFNQEFYFDAGSSIGRSGSAATGALEHDDSRALVQ